MANPNSIQLFEKKRSRNFISRLMDKDVNDERDDTRHTTNINGTIYFLKPGIAEYQSVPCVMSDLSTGGAFIKTANNELTKQYVYLLLDDVPHKFKAAIIGYSKNGYHIRFPKKLPIKAVEMIVRGQASQMRSN